MRQTAMRIKTEATAVLVDSTEELTQGLSCGAMSFLCHFATRGSKSQLVSLQKTLFAIVVVHPGSLGMCVVKKTITDNADQACVVALLLRIGLLGLTGWLARLGQLRRPLPNALYCSNASRRVADIEKPKYRNAATAATGVRASGARKCANHRAKASRDAWCKKSVESAEVKRKRGKGSVRRRAERRRVGCTSGRIENEDDDDTYAARPRRVSPWDCDDSHSPVLCL